MIPMLQKLGVLLGVTWCLINPSYCSEQLSEQLFENEHMYAVILAGGTGSRLWPLSREQKPKHFLEFSDHKTLLEHTVDRIRTVIPQEHIWTITNKAYEKDIRSLLGNSIGNIISEPSQRNTGPALLLACLQLEQHDPNAVVLFLPADHTIKEETVFCQGLQTSLNYVKKNDGIALIGLQPTFPATGYGYIEYGKSVSSKLYKVVRFHEKPPLIQAQEYVAAGNMLWNGGYFCGRVATFIALFQKHAPLLYEQTQGFLNGTVDYTELMNISFDHAIMEHADNTYVLPLEITWSDIGNLTTFLSSLQAYQHQLDNVITIDAHNNLIHNNSTKLTALIGVDDLCIVNTGDVLLVSHQKDVERVKEILAQLQKTGHNDLRTLSSKI